MPYHELSGNIFNSKADALVNTVNCVGVMGKGIALEFRRRYPKMFKEYKGFCQRGELKPGQILPYRKEQSWILNFAIKNHWRNPSKTEWVEFGSLNFIIFCNKKSVQISVPQLEPFHIPLLSKP